LPSPNVSPWEMVQLSAHTLCNETMAEGEYSWYIKTIIGSSIDENGVYRAGGIAGTDTITVIDTINGNCLASAVITVSPLWPMAYDEMWGEKKGDYLSLLRTFRDEILAKSEVGRDHVFMLYNHSLEILILLLLDPSLTQETKSVIDELLPEIISLLNGGEITLSQEKIARIDSLISHLEAKATPQLSRALEKVKWDLRDRKLFTQLTVEKIEGKKVPLKILPSYKPHP